MFHAYQGYGEVPDSYNNSSANLEIEANIAQYRYLSKLSEYKNDGKWSKVYKGTSLGRNIVQLSIKINSKGDLIDNSKTLEFNSLFAGLGSEVIKMNSTYKFDYNRTYSDNLKNIQTLSKNCN